MFFLDLKFLICVFCIFLASVVFYKLPSGWCIAAISHRYDWLLRNDRDRFDLAVLSKNCSGLNMLVYDGATYPSLENAFIKIK